MKRLLYVDTSLSGFLLAALELSPDRKLKVLDTHLCEQRRSTAQMLSNAFFDLFGPKGVESFDGAVVAKGPGTFTGLRIGMSWVLGLFGSEFKYAAIPSIEMIAKNKNTTILLPATKTMGYYACPEIGCGPMEIADLKNPSVGFSIEDVTHVQWDELEQIKDAIKASHPELKVWGALTFKEALESSLSSMVELVNAGRLDLLWENQLAQPYYARLSSAEERLKATQKEF